jgi:hypothetical protein
MQVLDGWNGWKGQAALPRTSPCSVQRQWIGWRLGFTFGRASFSRSDADGEDGCELSEP